MEKRDYAIATTFTHDEKTYKVDPAPNTISKCSGCVFYKPPTRTLRSECYAPDGIRCSFPDRIFKEVANEN